MLPLISIIVVIAVFWWLKLTGITMAGGAFCGYEDHIHTEDCYRMMPACGREEGGEYGHFHSAECFAETCVCGKEEHLHDSTCYSNIKADLEAPEDWESTLPVLHDEALTAERIVEIAKSQLDYTESVQNFTIDDEGIRRGYTRYGEWYGNPYGKWSTMFVSFCLRYAGLEDVPINSGAEAMLVEWDEEELYKDKDNYTPIPGDVVFFDKNENGTVETAAIVIELEDGILTVIEGDYEDAVTEVEYGIDDVVIVGYGLSSPKNSLVVVEPETEPDTTDELESGDIPAEDETFDEVGDDMAEEDSTEPTDETTEDETDEEASNEKDGGGDGVLIDPDEEENRDAPGDTYAVWLDGTNGGLRSYSGSANTMYQIEHGDVIKLPAEWQSPAQYGYAVRGWYDVTNSVYYKPGDEVTVTGNMVLYTDWVPATYDIGRFNAYTSNTISSNHIITTKLFDYNYLFNILSSKATVRVDQNSHSETWSHVSSGTVPYKNAETIDFIFKDNDSGGKLSLANNRSYNNDYHNANTVSTGIYNEKLAEILFGTGNSFNPETGEGILGKTYLGTGDQLFQYMDNPASEYYGYYYFDSKLHAASYNMSEQRFYVYDYLSRSSDSNGQGAYGNSDFLPLNSPYANTNGKTVDTYTYNGELGEYSGVSHYEYDVGYSNSNYVGANMAFGMSMEMKFYLPGTPGERGENGEYVNLDLYGNEMSYTFSGDDDVWVLVDGEVRLDIGGIHQIVSGTINFSSGIVTVDGSQTDTIYDLEPGDHVLTIYYLERGSSQSNCAMYFNIAPRYSLTLQKEDVLTQELLDGAQFSIYMDPECTVPANLWESENDYDNNAPSQNTFVVENGIAEMWGMSPGITYYLKETKAPDNPGYERAHGIIRFEFDIQGIATFDIEIEEESPGEGVSKGYTVHGYHINTETQAAYITVTNAQTWVKDITTVQIVKVWDDTEDHSTDYVSVYLTVTDPDGTVRRIREAVLGEENNRTYTWTNLPKHAADGVTEIAYGAEESYTQGYSSIVEKVDKIIVEDETWESYRFEDGDEYLLKVGNQYLSAENSNSSTFKLVDEETAKREYGQPGSLSTWVASVSGNTVRLQNKNGQKIVYSSSGTRVFSLTKNNSNYQNITVSYSDAQSGYTFSFRSGNRTYYASSLNTRKQLSTTTYSSGAIYFTPILLHKSITEIESEGIAYKITNTPLEAETSLTVTKYWDTGIVSDVSYETSQVTVKLLANGKDTGRTVTLSLKNSWTATFMGLPYHDDRGEVIAYSVEEVWTSSYWEPVYGEVIAVGSGIPTYKTSVTNVYVIGHGYELPSTGGCGTQIWVLSGLTLMLGSLVSLYIFKRRYLRRNGV